MLATFSLLPIIRRFTDDAGIAVELSDISVAARILAQFPERLSPAQVRRRRRRATRDGTALPR